MIPKPFPATLSPVRRLRTRWDEDNEAPLNPWAFVAVAGFVLALVGLALLITLT